MGVPLGLVGYPIRRVAGSLRVLYCLRLEVQKRAPASRGSHRGRHLCFEELVIPDMSRLPHEFKSIQTTKNNFTKKKTNLRNFDAAKSHKVITYLSPTKVHRHPKNRVLGDEI